MSFDFFHEEIGFIFRLLALHDTDRRPEIVLRPQIFFLSLCVCLDHRARSREDAFGRAVILFEPHHLGGGKVVLEFQDVADAGAAPSINRLVRVAGGADVLAAQCQAAGDHVLRVVGVLILVDQHVAEAVFEVRPEVRIVAEQEGRLEQQVVEVDRLLLFEQLLVDPIDPGDGLFREAHGPGFGGVLFGREQAGFGIADVGLDLDGYPVGRG